MRRCADIFLGYSFPHFSCHACLGFSPIRLPFLVGRYLSQSLHSSSNTRPFPNYSPKKPTILDAQLVHQISNAIKLRHSEPLRHILKSYESKFRSDHLIWVLMNIRHDYKLALDFFDWACLRRDPNLEARCIIVQIAVASKDLKLAHDLICDFWEKPNLDFDVSFTHFVDRLIYTYKQWGSDPHVFDIFFQVLIEVGMLDEARSFFDKLLNYGVVISTDSCNLYLARLSDNFDRLRISIKVFNEFPQVGVCWNTASCNIIINSLCRLGRVKEAHCLLMQMKFRGNAPDVVSYSTVINGYCLGGELQKVLKLIQEMQMKGLKPNLYTYNSIILLLCKSGKVDDAERVLREMINQGIVPDTVVYTTLIDGFCKLGNIQAAYKLFDEMEKQRIVPDFIAYTAVI
ncbi:hypothetical protein D5086_019233, partial [Populus alba]